MKVKSFTYKKADGSTSERTAILIKEPQINHLMIDLTDLDEVEQNLLINLMDEAEAFKTDILSDFIDLIKWRTFKPGGIEWRS